MSQPAFKMLNFSHAVLRLLSVLNLAAAILCIAGIAVTFAAESTILDGLARERDMASAQTILASMRIVLVIALVAIPLAHLVFSRLLAMIETVRSGDPFVADNARRLTQIAWAMLGIQLLDLAFGAISISAGPSEILSGWTFNVTGWLAVLLLFVLARVFEQGTAMRADIEGTI